MLEAIHSCVNQPTIEYMQSILVACPQFSGHVHLEAYYEESVGIKPSKLFLKRQQSLLYFLKVFINAAIY